MRGAASALAAMLNETDPMPDPLAPTVIVIHVAAVVEVQEHCVPVTMLRVRLVFAASTEKLVGVTV